MKTKTWRIIFFGWLLLILLLGAIGCAVLYRYLAVYEISRPELVMDEFMASVSNDDLYAAVKDRFTGGLSDLEDPLPLLEEYYQSSLRDAALSYRKDTGHSDQEQTVFIVRAGSVNFAQVFLVPAEGDRLPFGLHRWTVDRIEPGDILAGLPSLRVLIDALPGQELYVNGSLLTEKYLADPALPCPDLSPLEQRFPVQPTLYRYRIDRMYGDISVTTADGERISPELDGSTVRFFAAGHALHHVELYAPSDVTVTLCGEELRAEDAVDRTPGILDGLDGSAGDGAFETLHFKLDGLYSAPELVVQDRGSVLQPVITEAGIEHYFHANDAALEEEVSTYVSRFFSAYTRYSTRAYSVDGQASLLGRILHDTALYDYILNSRDTMIWAVTTDVNNYEDLRFTDFHRLNEDCFVCTVRYKANMTTNARQGAYTYDEENIAELCFVRSNGQYYCAAMSFVTD